MSYEAYLKGTGAYEGTGEKTPEWAAAITGVSAENIRMLADVFVNGPTAAIQGWGPQRHSNGGNSARAIGLIAAITGNAGISGGGTGAREATGGVSYKTPSAIPAFPEKNTVEPVISFFEWFRAIEDYKSMTDATWGLRRVDEEGNVVHASEPGEISLKAPIKFIWNYASNVMMGQHADINDCLRIYNLPDEKDSGLRCIVTCDVYMTPTAMVSDYILPGTTSFEEIDVTKGGSAWTGFVMCETPAIEPMFESKPVYEICTMLSEQLGVKDEFTEGKTQEDWVKWCYEKGKEKGDALPDTFEEFKEGGLFKQTDDHEPAVADTSEIATPSGKYEVFSKQAYNISKQWDLTAAGYTSRRRPRPNHAVSDLVRKLRKLRRRRDEEGLSVPVDRTSHQDAHALVLRQRRLDEIGRSAAMLDQYARRGRVGHRERRYGHREHEARLHADFGQGDRPHHAGRRIHSSGSVVRPRDARCRQARRPERARPRRLHLGAYVAASDGHLQG